MADQHGNLLGATTSCDNATEPLIKLPIELIELLLVANQAANQESNRATN